MTTRTQVKVVHFIHPFHIPGIDDALPPGDYEITTDEEQVGGMQVQGWRRFATTILLSRDGALQRYPVMPVALDAMLMRDKGLTIIPPILA